MASLDIYRPAAQEQLITLGTDNKISVLANKIIKNQLILLELPKRKQRITTLMS